MITKRRRVKMNWITSLISTSPSPADPSVEQIQRTVRKVREYPELKDQPVFIMCDGVYDNLRYRWQSDLDAKTGASDEILQERIDRYAEYKARLLPWCAENGIQTLVCEQHTHRANMIRQALTQIQTACILPLDHDTYPIGEIPWDNLRLAMEDPRVNAIRFYYLPEVHVAHRELISSEIETIAGVPIAKTVQYSDSGNIQRADFMRYILERYIGKESKCFIEDALYPIWDKAKWDGWDVFKMWVYLPENAQHYTHEFSRADWTAPVCDLYHNVFPISAVTVKTIL
jgi:hypothetical protein